MLRKIALVTLFAVAASVSLHASPWMSHNSRRAPKYMVVTGNYKTPRLMAATINGLTRQPYLIMTADGSYFAVLSKDTCRIPGDKLDVYINKLNPGRIVIIGDERYVTPAQEQLLRRINMKRIPIVRIYGGDWMRIAEELDDMLNIGNLPREFSRNYYEYSMSDPRLRDPGSPAPATAAPAAAAPAAPAAGAADDGAKPVAEPEALPL